MKKIFLHSKRGNCDESQTHVYREGISALTSASHFKGKWNENSKMQYLAPMKGGIMEVSTYRDIIHDRHSLLDTFWH